MRLIQSAEAKRDAAATRQTRQTEALQGHRRTAGPRGVLPLILIARTAGVGFVGLVGLVGLAGLVGLVGLVGLSGVAEAATLPTQGSVRTVAGGPVPDGDYVFVARLYDQPDAVQPIWEELQNKTAVQWGFFHLELGTKTPIDAALLEGGADLWLGFEINAGDELPRVPVNWVVRAWHAKVAASASFAYATSDQPGGAALGLACTGCIDGSQIAANAVQSKHVSFTYAGSKSKDGPATEAEHALTADKATEADHAGTADQTAIAALADKAKLAEAAEELQCSGCLGLAHLAPATQAAFLSSQGGKVSGAVEISGGLDLAGSTLGGANLAAAEIAKAVCTGAERGRMTVDSATADLWFCTGVAWKKVKLCGGACKKAVEVPCGQPISDDCGDLGVCPGAGSLCAGGLACDGKQCVGPGESQESALADCKALKAAAPDSADGVYWIDPNGGGKDDAFEAWCDMTTDGGGWTLLGTVFGGDSENWNTEVGYWGDTKPLGTVAAKYADFKSPAWYLLDVSKADVLYQRRYAGATLAQVKLGNPCLFGKALFHELFKTWDTSMRCENQHITTVLAAGDATGLASATYMEGGGADALGGSGTAGWCWNGGDSSGNIFKGHAGWNQTGYGGKCYVEGHLGYIGVFSIASGQYTQIDIDATNWLGGSDKTKTAVSFFAR